MRHMHTARVVTIVAALAVAASALFGVLRS
jgi:hypothetical protein